MNGNKLGRFEISNEMLTREHHSVSRVFTMLGFVPIRIIQDVCHGSTVYEGSSEFFDDTPLEQEPPMYSFSITKSPSKISIEVSRRIE